MYAKHFGLREPPFNNTPDPRYFFATPDHDEALASLIYTVTELKGYAVLTGEVGAGKTLVSRMMLRHFGDRVASAVINNTALGADDLLAATCSEFDLPAPADAGRFHLVRQLQDFLLAEFAANRPVVLVLDEAQNLPYDAFEQLRMIGNLEADDAKLLQVIIVGQPELRERFEANNMRQLRQRVFRSYHLPALSRSVCAEYIRHRLRIAGLDSSALQRPAEADLFDREAVDAIHAFSQGLPRLVNTACDNALLSAYAADRKQVEGSFMAEVIAQMTAQAPALTTTGSPFDAPKMSAGPAPSSCGLADQSAVDGLERRLMRLEARFSETAIRIDRLAERQERGGLPDLRQVAADLNANATAACLEGPPDGGIAQASRVSPAVVFPGPAATGRHVKTRLDGIRTAANRTSERLRQLVPPEAARPTTEMPEPQAGSATALETQISSRSTDERTSAPNLAADSLPNSAVNRHQTHPARARSEETAAHSRTPPSDSGRQAESSPTPTGSAVRRCPTSQLADEVCALAQLADENVSPV